MGVLSIRFWDGALGGWFGLSIALERCDMCGCVMNSVDVVMSHVDGAAVQVVEVDSMDRHVSGVRCDAVLS